MAGGWWAPELAIENRQWVAGMARCLERSMVIGNRFDGPNWPTEGRVLLRRGGVAAVGRCTASPGEPRLATAQYHPGQMVPYNDEPL